MKSLQKNKKKLAILGANGLLGSDLALFLSTDFNVISITRGNYEKHKSEKFDIFINANGNSRRFWAIQNPQEDFIASTDSVHKSIFDFPSKFYIYISSPDVYENHEDVNLTSEDTKNDIKNLSAYGFHKYLSELIVKKYQEEFLIIRPANILGTKLKKGPIFDIINNNPLFITLDSQLQFVTTKAIAEVIKTLIDKSITNEIFNVGGEGTFDFKNTKKYFKQEIKISDDATKQIYQMNVEKLKSIYKDLKTSEEYLQEFVRLL